MPTECHNVNSGISAEEMIGIGGRLHLGPVSEDAVSRDLENCVSRC